MHGQVNSTCLMAIKKRNERNLLSSRLPDCHSVSLRVRSDILRRLTAVGFAVGTVMRGRRAL